MTQRYRTHGNALDYWVPAGRLGQRTTLHITTWYRSHYADRDADLTWTQVHSRYRFELATCFDHKRSEFRLDFDSKVKHL